MGVVVWKILCGAASHPYLTPGRLLHLNQLNAGADLGETPEANILIAFIVTPALGISALCLPHLTPHLIPHLIPHLSTSAFVVHSPIQVPYSTRLIPMSVKLRA